MAFSDSGIDGAAELPAAFEAARQQADALIIFTHAGSLSNRDQFVELAAQHRLPTMYGVRQFADAGGLIAYGPSLYSLYRRSATHVDKIIKGAKPADLPIEQSIKFEWVVNLKTAQTLGLTIPHAVLTQATDVLQ